jgi:acetyltransferase-like isoleucine patch superfamily enzyme
LTRTWVVLESSAVLRERLLTALRNRRARYALRRCAAVGIGPRVDGRVWIHGGGRIVVGDRVHFEGAEAPIEIHSYPGATITIGSDSVIQGGTSIEATAEVTIGPRCRVGAFCKVIDSDFHPLKEPGAGVQVTLPGVPVRLEEDVVLDRRAIILAGARIGRGSRIAAFAVVRGRVPPESKVEGNPARWRARGTS